MAESLRSVESLLPPLIKGYPEVAAFMSENPEMAMFRRFRGLNARNLLYLQAELVYIEKDLLRCEEDDAKSTDQNVRQYSKDYFWIMNSEKTKSTQKNLIKKMREKLKEYNDVLIQQTTLDKISNPTDYDRTVMQKWFERKDLANMPLEGDDSSIWAQPRRIEDGPGVSRHYKDLIAINERGDDVDDVTVFIAEKIIPMWHGKIASKLHKNRGIKTFREKVFSEFTSIIATILSSLLPVLSIVVLYVVHNMHIRLGIIAAFTAGFALLVSVITSASRVENFAATSAFAAVQVVFVNANGNSSSSG
ncbi:hypothetical protein B7494_g5215 [Chlorociboria aeruginascens]|nr:hypothetical protein B7494_g5215 [Chlorociboria aeruginascens]